MLILWHLSKYYNLWVYHHLASYQAFSIYSTDFTFSAVSPLSCLCQSFLIACLLHSLWKNISGCNLFFNITHRTKWFITFFKFYHKSWNALQQMLKVLEDGTRAKNLLWLVEQPQDQVNNSCPFSHSLPVLQ